MNVTANDVLDRDPRKTANVALKTFFNIMEKWRVKNEVQKVLLGGPSQGTFYKWKQGDVANLSRDTLERISYILGIYKALGMLFPTRAQADAWPNKQNEAFDGETAIEFMAKGSIVQLVDMRRYLDAQRG